jgi:hypothetical protein
VFANCLYAKEKSPSPIFMAGGRCATWNQTPAETRLPPSTETEIGPPTSLKVPYQRVGFQNLEETFLGWEAGERLV